MPTHSAPSNASRALTLDETFMRSVHRANVALTLLFGLMILFGVGQEWALGFTALGLWSAANLWVLERLLRAATRPDGRDPVTIAVVGIVKLPILYGALIALLLWADLPPFAVITGLSVPIVVIFLKALGAVVAGATSPKASTESRS